MARRSHLGRIATNIGLMLVVSLPLFTFLVWIEGLLFGPGSTDQLLGSFAFAYVLLLLPAIGGALIQQLVLDILARRLPRIRRRMLAVATCLLILLLAPVFGVAPAFLLQPLTLTPALIALVLFGLLQRLPPSDLTQNSLPSP